MELDLQGRLHLVKGALGLIEEAKDDSAAEFLVVIVVHFEDLFKGVFVDAVFHVGKGEFPFLEGVSTMGHGCRY